MVLFKRSKLFVLFKGIRRLQGLRSYASQGFDRQGAGFPLQLASLALAAVAFGGVAATSGILDPILSKKFY